MHRIATGLFCLALAVSGLVLPAPPGAVASPYQSALAGGPPATADVRCTDNRCIRLGEDFCTENGTEVGYRCKRVAGDQCRTVAC